MVWSNYAAYAKWQVVWFYLFKFQPMPCGTCFFSFTKCQMALVAMVFYTPCFFPFSLCQLSNNVHILSVYNQVLHDKSCVWFGKKGALIHHYRASWILELFGWKWFLEEFWLKGIKLFQIPINLCHFLMKWNRRWLVNHIDRMCLTTQTCHCPQTELIGQSAVQSLRLYSKQYGSI